MRVRVTCGEDDSYEADLSCRLPQHDRNSWTKHEDGSLTFHRELGTDIASELINCDEIIIYNYDDDILEIPLEAFRWWSNVFDCLYEYESTYLDGIDAGIPEKTMFDANIDINDGDFDSLPGYIEDLKQFIKDYRPQPEQRST